MALNKAGLQSDLEDWMNGKDGYNSISDSMTVFMDAYETYSMDALDVSGDGPALLNKATALSILNTLALSATADSAAQAFEDAIIAFWTGGSFVTATPPPGTIAPEISADVTGPPTPGPLKSALFSVFNDLAPDGTVSGKAGQLATAFDTSAKTVVVTCVGTDPSSGAPVPVPGPIS